MHLLFPSNPLNPSKPDEQYLAESKAATELGITFSIFSFEQFLAGEFHATPALQPRTTIVYRGWMMKPVHYFELNTAIANTHSSLLTSPEQYELCHYLPRWYPFLESHTPETFFFSETDDISARLRSVGWTSCFLKDYVKSVATAGGSIARDLSEIPSILATIKKYRGEIEGGVCARRIEDFQPHSEERYIVYDGKPFARQGNIPEIVILAAQHISSPFFSVDVARRRDGVMRIIELGDGQVSDRKQWKAKQLLAVLQ